MSIVSRPFAELVVAGPEEGVSKVLAAGHTTAADFDAHCAALTADYEPPEDEDALSSGGFYGG
jgi:hypothetical protein